jgi:glycosyltransferase involved in cell wall biosynthesis
VRSAVRDGVSGVIVPPTDVRAVAATIRDLLRDDDKRASMGANARRLVETYYNWERVARDTRDFTHRVVRG